MLLCENMIIDLNQELIKIRNERDEELYSPPPPQLEARKLKADRTKLQELSITENKFRKDTFIEEKRGQSPTLELNDFRQENKDIF